MPDLRNFGTAVVHKFGLPSKLGISGIKSMDVNECLGGCTQIMTFLQCTQNAQVLKEVEAKFYFTDIVSTRHNVGWKQMLQNIDTVESIWSDRPLELN